MKEYFIEYKDNTLPWKLTKFSYEIKHLFSNLKNFNFQVELFLCNCGYKEFIIKSEEQNITYSCVSCKNKKFLDANYAWNKIENFLDNQTCATTKFLIEKTKDGIVSFEYINIPRYFSIIDRKVNFKKKILSSLLLTYEGNLIKENDSFYNKEVFNILEKKLNIYLNKHRVLDIPYSETEKMTVTKASFFLKRPNFKSFELYYWRGYSERYINVRDPNLTEFTALGFLYSGGKKSVKKAIYENYVYQISQYGTYDCFFISLFTHRIEDPNILVGLIRLNLEWTIHNNFISSKNDFTCDANAVSKFIFFLFDKGYKEKDLLKVFSSIKNDGIIFKDTIQMIIRMEYEEELENIIEKVSSNIYKIHDEIIKKNFFIENKYYLNELISFNYIEKEKIACTIIKEYEIKLPKDSNDLYNWAKTLNNCMTEYALNIKNKNTIIYCFFNKKKLCFAVELVNNTIIQATGINNNDLGKEEKQILDLWYSKYFLYSITEINENNINKRMDND